MCSSNIHVSEIPHPHPSNRITGVLDLRASVLAGRITPVVYMQHYKKYTVPTNLWEQPIGNHHLLFPQSLLEQLVPQICRNNQWGTNFLFPQSSWEQRCSHKDCGNTMWFLLSGKEKVMYQMKKSGFRL